MDGKKILQNRALAEEVIAMRRYIHENPCVSEHEEETVKYVAEKLKQWEIPHEIILSGCSVVACIQGAEAGPVIGVRADMDALPIQEETGLPFASKIPGVMHACGHDCHTAILLGVARVLAGMRGQLKGCVKLLFQPAEESIGGAQRMIEAGCLENPHVDYVLGLHVAGGHPTGKVGIRYGKMYAASDMIDITVHGKSSHGASPHEGVDAIAVAAAIISTVQTVVSRKVSPVNSAVCSFGMIHGGTVRNQISDRVELSGIIRTLDPDTRVFVRNQVKQVVEGVAKSMGAEAQFRVTESYGPLMNNDEVTSLVERNVAKLLGQESVILEPEPQLGCEDFSYFAMERPGCFFHLGCYHEKLGERVGAHNCGFTVDEDALIIGVALQVENVLALMEKGEATCGKTTSL